MSMHGIGMAPARKVPTIAICHSGSRGSITTTRSPLPTPCAARRFANRHDARAMSPNVKRRSRPASSHQTSAGLPSVAAQ